MTSEQTKTLSDLHISGSGDFSGGEYGKVSISGSGKGAGDVACEVFKVSGSAKLEGALTCETCSVSGSMKMTGNLAANESLHISGSQHVDGDVDTTTMKVSGSAHVGGELTAQTLSISGSLAVGGDCHASNAKISGGIRVKKGMECEDLAISGDFNIGGLLNVGKLEVRIGGGCRCGEIGGDEIIVTDDLKSDGLIVAIARLLGKRSHHRLTTSLIEGNRITLECTDADIVRGQNVVIGKNCKIGRVEYSGTLEVLDNAEVGERIKA